MSDRQRLIREEIAQSELTRDDPMPAEAVGTRKNREQPTEVYSLRLPAAVLDEVQRIAKQRDVPVSVLVRGFIADGIAMQQSMTVQGLVDHIMADIQKVKGLVGK